MDYGAIDLKKGGGAIPITWKTRRIRDGIRGDAREQEGVQPRMNPAFYERPPKEGEDVLGDVMYLSRAPAPQRKERDTRIPCTTHRSGSLARTEGRRECRLRQIPAQADAL